MINDVYQTNLKNCIKFRIKHFLTLFFFFYYYQFGFLQCRSVNNAHFFVNKYIHNNLNLSNTTMSLFIDVRKVFDSINHELLLNKLYYAGIKGTENYLIISYLTSRVQVGG